MTTDPVAKPKQGCCPVQQPYMKHPSPILPVVKDRKSAGSQ